MMEFTIIIVLTAGILLLALTVLCRVRHNILSTYEKVQAQVSDVKRFERPAEGIDDDGLAIGWECTLTYRIGKKTYTCHKEFGCTKDVKSPYNENETLTIFVHPKYPEKTVHMLGLNIAILIVASLLILFTILGSCFIYFNYFI